MTARPGASATVARAVAELPAVGLPEVITRAALQTRVEGKYLVPVERIASLLAQMSGRFAALEINRRRMFAYDSVYFDTPDLLTFRHHVQGRRRRYKVRTRAYLDSDDCMLEIKRLGHRGQTVKERQPHPIADRYALTAPAWSFLIDHLWTAHALVPPPLGPVVSTAYRRATLVDLEAAARVTLDVELVCAGAGRRVGGLHTHVLVETKGSDTKGRADRLLRGLGLQAMPASKYGIAVALLYPEMTANRWHRTLQRYFHTEGGGTCPPTLTTANSSAPGMVR